MPSKSPSKSELRQLWRSSHPTPEVRAKHRVRFATLWRNHSKRSMDPSWRSWQCTMNPIWMRLLTNWLGASRQVLAPLVQWEEGTMAPTELRAPLPEPHANPKGKPREPNGDVVAQVPPDVVLIPGVAFTAEGSRLGRGGGFYDRFLRSLPKSSLRIGVCFSTQIMPVLPIERHDESVSFLLTEAGWIGSPPCQE